MHPAGRSVDRSRVIMNSSTNFPRLTLTVVNLHDAFFASLSDTPVRENCPARYAVGRDGRVVCVRGVLITLFYTLSLER